jgi:hypothetical protein
MTKPDDAPALVVGRATTLSVTGTAGAPIDANAALRNHANRLAGIEARAFRRGWEAAREAAAMICDAVSEGAMEHGSDAHIAAEEIRAMEPPA